MKTLFTLCLIASTTTLLPKQSFISKVYCQLLGNTDVKQEYKSLAYQALKDFGVDNPTGVPVKHMNRTGQRLALVPVSSFTAFGIWLDEQALDESTADEVIFQIYHEAAHYALKHHPKLLGSYAAINGILFASAKLMHEHLNSSNNKIISTVEIIGTIAISLVSLEQLVIFQEKNADKLAAQKLIELGKKNIVEARIKGLEQSGRNSNLWWPTNEDQINYLKI